MMILRTGPLTADERAAVLECISNMPIIEGDDFPRYLLTRLLGVGDYWRGILKTMQPYPPESSKCSLCGYMQYDFIEHAADCPWMMAQEEEDRPI